MRTLWLVLLLTSVACAARSDVKDQMDAMLEQLLILKPFIASDVAFSDPDNAGTIATALDRMARLSKAINHEEKISKTGFGVSAAVLSQQLEELAGVFDHGNKQYALWSLRATLGVCMACHTQLPAGSTRFTALSSDQILASAFEEAEFLFVIRNFDAAMPLYSGVIAAYPHDGVTPGEVEKSVYRQLYYYLRVARDPQGLARALRGDAANPRLPAHLREQITNLADAAERAREQAYPRFTASEAAALHQYVATLLGDAPPGDVDLDAPERAIAALTLSSVLYEFLNAHPDTPLKPDILYWLSLSERRFLFQSMHSLPDLYLRQCVLEHPASPVASQCLADYVDSMTVAFTGSGGTHMPADVTQELQHMQALVKQAR